LLLVGWIGLYEMGMPVWVPWAEQPDPARADKTKAAADAEAQRKAAEAEQQRLAAIKEEEQRQAKAADVEAKLKAAEAEQQRLKEEVQRQSKAAADAEAKRKAAEAEQQRLKEEQQRQAQAALTDSFERRSNIMATGWPTSPFRDNGGSMGECERKCSQSAARQKGTYNKNNGKSNFYLKPSFFINN